MEAARRGTWQADSRLLTALGNRYITLVNQFGVTCCHHTCANMAFNQFVVMGSSLSLDQLQQFANTLRGATGRTVDVPAGAPATPGTPAGAPAAPGPGRQPSPATPGMEVRAAETGEQPGEGEIGDQGQRAYEVITGNQGLGQPSMPAVAIVGVILLICLIAVGYFKADILSLFGLKK
jgi:cobaltochelatase CobN